jgi:eukaryotic-like serine/threonine-protein kinase
LGEPNDRERSLIDAAWSQFEDLARRSSTGSRSSGSFCAHTPVAGERLSLPCFPGYRVVEELRRGGQGVVLLGVQQSTGRRVAIKMLRHGTAAGAAERARFEREIDLLTRLRHPNIVAVHDRGWADAIAYFVMDFVAGASLDEHLEAGHGAPREIAAVFEKIAEAVSAAHLLGVIHRDLKPSNIRFDERGEPKVLDFGLARLTDDPGEIEREITQPGQFIGSLPWASPEQVQSDAAALDVRTDVYSLGVMLYHSLTGEFPYAVSGSAPAVIQHIVGTAPSHTALRSRRLDQEISTIVLKCLAKEPERRYQSAGELARDLGRYVRGEAIDAKRESTWYALRKLAGRNRLAVALAGIALVAVVSGGIASSIMYARAESARALADKRYGLAKARTAQTRRTLQFLGKVFSSVDPYVAAGMDTRLVERMLEDARERAEIELDSEPAVRAAVHDMLGVSLAVLGRIEPARAELLEGLRMWRATGNDVSEHMLDSLVHLATLEEHAGNFDLALEYCRQVEQLQALLPESSEEYTADRLHIEASIASGRSEFEKALALARQARDIRRRLPESDYDRIQSEYDVAGVLMSRGDTDEARRLYEGMLAAMSLSKGLDHPVLVPTLTSLGQIAIDAQDPDKAREYLDRALAICRASYPRAHFKTARVLTSLSRLTTTLGRYEEGLSYAQEALAIRKELVGEDAPPNAASVLSVGTALKNLGRLDEAESYYHEALRLTEKDGSRQVRATALNNLAALYKKRGKFEQSARLDEETLALRRQLFPGDHADVAQSLNNLAVSLGALGRNEEAEVLYRECLAMQTALFGEQSRPVAMTCVNLYERVLKRDPGNDQACELIRRSVSVLETTQGDPTWLLRGRFILAGALSTRREFADAERLLCACDEMIRSGQSSRITRSTVLELLVEVCEKQGKSDEAARWRAELGMQR